MRHYGSHLEHLSRRRRTVVSTTADRARKTRRELLLTFDRAVSVVKWGQKPDGCVDSKDISDKELLSKI